MLFYTCEDSNHHPIKAAQCNKSWQAPVVELLVVLNTKGAEAAATESSQGPLVS
jgi:hypothetical protein